MQRKVSKKDSFENIQEVISSKEHDDDVDQERIELWEPLEFLDRRKYRLYLTRIGIGVWLATMAVALERFALTGDYIPVVALLSILLGPLVAYYYCNHQRKKGTRKGKRK